MGLEPCRSRTAHISEQGVQEKGSIASPAAGGPSGSGTSLEPWQHGVSSGHCHSCSGELWASLLGSDFWGYSASYSCRKATSDITTAPDHEVNWPTHLGAVISPSGCPSASLMPFVNLPSCSLSLSSHLCHWDNSAVLPPGQW